MSNRSGRSIRGRGTRTGLAIVVLLSLWPTGSTLAQDKAAGGDAGSSKTEAPAVSFEQESAELRALAEDWAVRTAEFEQARSDAPERLAALELEIKELLAIDVEKLPVKEKNLQELEARIDLEEQQLNRARQESASLDADAARRTERRKKIPELQAAASERLAALDQSNRAAAPAAPTDGAETGDAGLAQLRRRVLESELLAYQAELGSYEARGQLLAKRRDLASVRIESLEAQIAKLRGAAKALQQLAAEREVEEARAVIGFAAGLPDETRRLVVELATANEDLARRRIGDEGVVRQIDETTVKLEQVREQIARVDANRADLIEKIEAGGLTDSVGILLREQRSNAPDVGKYRRFIRIDEETLAKVQIDQIELRERRRGLANVDKRAEQALATLGDVVSPGERARTLSVLRQIFETERNYTDALLEDLDDYFQKLVDLDSAQRTLIDRTDLLLQFIDERILWVPSGTPIAGSSTASDAAEAIAWLFAPRYSEQITRVIRDVALGRPFVNLLAAVALVIGIGAAGRARREIRALGERARRPDCADFTPTWQSFGLTLLLTAWTPGVLGYLAWRVATSPEAAQYGRSLAHGLFAVAVVWVSLRLPRQVLRRGGLAEAHFGWPAVPVGATRAQLFWLTTLVLPACFLIYTFQMRGDETWNESVGRIAFVVCMAALAVFARLTFRAGDGIAAAVAGSNGWRPGRWSWRLAHAASVGIPLLLAVAALRGYYWTSLQLAARMHMTIVFLFALFLIAEVGARWSLIASRRVARETARGFGAATDGADGADFMDAPRGGASDVPTGGARASDPIDLASVRAQTSRLTTSAMLFLAAIVVWIIWVDVLPAVGFLREVELWTTTREVSLATLDANGVERLSTGRQLVPITLANLVFATLIGLVSFAVVRNLPGLLEISVLRRFPAGERYAYTTIAKYAATILGVVLTFDAIGIGWSSIQWLVAAIGLGLGFGLQEIFANFISGLIILFERPIRVGDTVTVGDLSGTVSKIRIRATWITGFDRKELVVPNKEFVTTRLINWSLTDPTLRVEVKIGIAYGSDTELALELLKRIASENPHVLSDPEPQALFLGFGESSLDFELRVFSPDVSHLLPIRHELHMAIDKAFRAAGIEIAFPQRDMHVRSLPEAWRNPPSGEAAVVPNQVPNTVPNPNPTRPLR